MQAMKDSFEGSIGQLAKASGTSIETIRFYQREKLIPVPPGSGGLRRYCQEDLNRLSVIKMAKSLGFTLKEVRGLLEMALLPAPPCDRIREKFANQREVIAEQLKALEDMKAAVENILASCRSSGARVDKCPILETMAPSKTPACLRCGA
jgi:DNA-binding transcriptional MerR regulator